MRETRVLIVDDQHLFSEGLKLVVEGQSSRKLVVVGVADNGAAAVELTHRLAPDVILMDIRMPGTDGIAATKKIRRDFPDVKILMLTTFDDEDLVLEALRSGANGYALKSIEPEELVTAVAAVVSGGFYATESVATSLISGEDVAGEQSDSQSLIREVLHRLPQLSIREAEVVRYILMGLRNQEIGESLSISEKTVRNHVSSIYEKLGIHSRIRLMSHLVALGIGR